MLTENEIQLWNNALENGTPGKILRWCWETFGDDVVLTSSFQGQSVVLLQLLAQEQLPIPVLFLDTGFHFPETLQFRDRLTKVWGLNLKILEPAMGIKAFKEQEGNLHERDPERCCHINKVAPLDKALEGKAAWITGIRRDQSSTREKVRFVSQLPNGLVKICPMANWTREQIADYIREHNLPEHLLTSQGYRSIGCQPCTRPTDPREDERSGRWAGSEKTECGIHYPPGLSA